MVDYIGVIFAVFMALGGNYGYVKSGNMISLCAGLITGSLVGFGTYQKDVGLCLCVSTFLLILHTYRYVLKQKFLPDAFTAAVCMFMTVYYGQNFRPKTQAI